MLLGVNIDHIATLRNVRGGEEPDVFQGAKICEEFGADGITVHLREDRRHIKDRDVEILSENLRIKLNLEMAMTDEIKAIALRILPHSCCIVPERRQELTTEGGLDVVGQIEKAKPFVKELIDAGINVSLFIDPDLAQISAASKTGANFIELHTGTYANAFGTLAEEEEYIKLKGAAVFAQNLGLKVNAGHGLNYQNVHRMLTIPKLYELNIGHSIISRAVFVGLPKAVAEMKELIN